MPRCIAENPKLSNIFVSASEKEATSTHSNLFYNLHKSNMVVLCRKPFSIFAAATSAFPAARPARRHHVSVHRSVLPPCIPESRKGLVNNGAISRHDCGGAAPMRRVSGGRLRNFAAGGSCRTFFHPPPDSELFATSFMCQSL